MLGYICQHWQLPGLAAPATSESSGTPQLVCRCRRAKYINTKCHVNCLEASFSTLFDTCVLSSEHVSRTQSKSTEF